MSILETVLFIPEVAKRWYGTPGMHGDRQKGKGNNNFRGGTSFDYYRRRGLSRAQHRRCAKCGATKNLVVDHKNGNRRDGRDSNLRLLCRSCNAKNPNNKRNRGKFKRGNRAAAG